MPALRQLMETGNIYGYVRDPDNKYQGIVSRDSLQRALSEREPRFVHAFLPDIDPIHVETPVHDILRTVAATECPVPVVDDHGTFLGAISRAILLRTLDRES
jgi:glycine betaine/proline transport system ATP-binding protein